MIPQVDKKTGYRTNTILCMPLRGDAASGHEVIGVIQVSSR